MSISKSALTTSCDIYRSNPPPANAKPASAGVACKLVGCYAAGTRALNTTLKTYTHYLVVDKDTDIRDGFFGTTNTWQYQNADTVYVPSGGHTPYVVVFVEVSGKGTGGEYKRAYLDRQAPAWPAL